MKTLILLFFILIFFSCTSENKTPPQEVNSTESAPPQTSITETPPLDPDMSNRERMQIELEALHKKLIGQMETGIDPKGVKKYLKDSEIYMNFYGDSLAAEHIFQAADLARGVGDYTNALEYWRIVYQAWARENHPKVPHAIFSIAFTYENFLNRKDLAKTMYKQLLARFPDHELAAETKKILKNIDKSPEELIKGFQKQ